MSKPAFVEPKPGLFLWEVADGSASVIVAVGFREGTCAGPFFPAPDMRNVAEGNSLLWGLWTRVGTGERVLRGGYVTLEKAQSAAPAKLIEALREAEKAEGEAAAKHKADESHAASLRWNAETARDRFRTIREGLEGGA